MDFFDSAPDGWQLVTLSQLGEVNRGRSRHRPRHDPILYGGPYPFIQTAEVKAADGLITRHRQTYSEAGLAQSRLWPGDTMCITIAANIAETAILTYPACFPDSVIGFIADPDRADVFFVEYAFRNLKRLIHHISSDSGTVQDNINLEFLGDMRFPVPTDVAEQTAIAKILRGLDMKIAHNRRQVGLFESYCRTLFASWFSDYEPVTAAAVGQRLPGLSERVHEMFPPTFIESELGPIPAGWEVARFSDLVASVESGSRPKGGVAGVVDGVPSLGAEHIEPLGEFHYSKVKFVSEEFFASMKRGVVRPRDIALYKDGAYVGKTTMWGEDFPYERCCVNEHVFLLRARESVGQEFLYFWMTDSGNNADLVNLNSNSAQPGLSRGALYTLRVVLPPEPIRATFAEVARPLLDGVFRNAKQIRDLTLLRDQLIPKLVTGELTVESQLSSGVTS